MAKHYPEQIVPFVNALTKLWATPCAITPAIWGEAALETAISMAEGQLEMGWKRAVEMVNGKSWLKTLNCRMAEAVIDKKPLIRSGRKFLHDAAELADRTGLYMFWGDTIEEGLYSWCSNAYEIAKCIPDDNQFWSYGEYPFLAQTNNGLWGEGPHFRSTLTGPTWSGGSVIEVPKGHGVTVSFALTGKLITGIPSPISSRLNDPHGVGIIATDFMSDTDAEKGYGTMLVAEMAPPMDFDRYVVVETMCPGPGFGITLYNTGYMSVQYFKY